jgi:hypothetical protein
MRSSMAKQGTEGRGLVAMLAGIIVVAARPSLADDAIDPEAKDAETLEPTSVALRA